MRTGWHILRSPGKTFVYRVKGEAAALPAAAEAIHVWNRRLDLPLTPRVPMPSQKCSPF